MPCESTALNVRCAMSIFLRKDRTPFVTSVAEGASVSNADRSIRAKTCRRTAQNYTRATSKRRLHESSNYVDHQKEKAAGIASFAKNLSTSPSCAIIAKVNRCAAIVPFGIPSTSIHDRSERG